MPAAFPLQKINPRAFDHKRVRKHNLWKMKSQIFSNASLWSWRQVAFSRSQETTDLTDHLDHPLNPCETWCELHHPRYYLPLPCWRNRVWDLNLTNLKKVRFNPIDSLTSICNSTTFSTWRWWTDLKVGSSSPSFEILQFWSPKGRDQLVELIPMRPRNVEICPSESKKSNQSVDGSVTLRL